MTLDEALWVLSPGAQYSFSGSDLSSLVWHDKVIARPADRDIVALMAEPFPKTVYTFAEWCDLFTPAEIAAVSKLRQTDPQVDVWLLQIVAIDQIDRSKTGTKAALDRLAAAGALTAARAADVLAGKSQS